MMLATLFQNLMIKKNRPLHQNICRVIEIKLGDNLNFIDIITEIMYTNPIEVNSFWIFFIQTSVMSTYDIFQGFSPKIQNS